MSFYLNKNNDLFFDAINEDIYVDKTMLINNCNKLIRKLNKFMCITRPRRFGKTMALSMLNAYYSKGCDSQSLFDKLNIAKDNSYLEHLNKHNVIWIDMASLYANIDNKEEIITELKKRILSDLKEKYRNVDLTNFILSDAIIKINNETKERFIFLIDEWDVIFREEEYNTKLCDDYIMFLRGLFKSSDVSSCIDLVYMTGILPIRRYSTQSTLNMFTEYDMINPRELDSFIGFTEDEVKDLCNKYHRDFNEIKSWYNGYNLNGISLYNPISVVEAVLRSKCKDYWVQTSAIESVTNYMNYDHGALKGIITRNIL